MIKLTAFKQTYFGGHLVSGFAEPALGFPNTQSPEAAIKLLPAPARDKWILCSVPETVEDNQPNEYLGMMYAVVAVAPIDVNTKNVLEGFPADDGVLDYWSNRWKRCLPILKWYDINEPRKFLDIHPDAGKISASARGRLVIPSWLTEAASLAWSDVTEREVYRTNLIQEYLDRFE